MPALFAPLVFLHVLAAIIALGPAFAFPLIGAMGGRGPGHGNFATRVTHVLDDRVVRPFILLTAATGLGMIWSRSLPVFDPAYRWLLLSIVLYAIALGFSILVQRPTMLRVIDLTGGFPGDAARAAPQTGSAPAGPVPPELVAAIGPVPPERDGPDRALARDGAAHGRQAVARCLTDRRGVSRDPASSHGR